MFDRLKGPVGIAVLSVLLAVRGFAETFSGTIAGVISDKQVR